MEDFGDILTPAQSRARREFRRRFDARLSWLLANRLPGQIGLRFRRCVLDRNVIAGRARGVCVWCGAQTASRRHAWHPECVRVYMAAKGQTVYAGGAPLIALDDCAICGAPATDIDHRDALVVAWTRDPQRAWTAWCPENLQALCRACHVDKTARDLDLLAALKKRENLCEPCPGSPAF